MCVMVVILVARCVADLIGLAGAPWWVKTPCGVATLFYGFSVVRKHFETPHISS